MKRSLLVSLMLTLVFTLMLVSIPVSFGQEARSYEAPEYPVPEKFNEAPMLAELVKEGKLPPVEERLPEEPFVVGPGVLVHEDDLPDWEVGKYGGVFRSVCLDPTLDWNLRDAHMENFLCTPAHYTKPLMGNIAAEFSVSPDNKIFTFRLRKGLKWSDGQPVTTEDVRFAYEDVLLNEEITPIFPADYRSAGDPAGTPMKIEILDEYTFRVEFDEPYGRFLRVLGLGSLWGGYDVLLKPSHYLKQFHIKYTPVEEMRPYLKELGYSDEEWWRLFLHKDISWGAVCERRAIGFPTLGPWVRADSPTNIMAFDRNPYYYKVDTAGNQLP
ncbi:MAG TPA: ABC transporter substrate-binding protein, partial [Candidatus Atribacteria bacterium]|nr:ABC transporter substrate-binding protein [Candidatus Atribacteria bacterium]